MRADLYFVWHLCVCFHTSQEPALLSWVVLPDARTLSQRGRRTSVRLPASVGMGVRSSCRALVRWPADFDRLFVEVCRPLQPGGLSDASTSPTLSGGAWKVRSVQTVAFKLHAVHRRQRPSLPEHWCLTSTNHRPCEKVRLGYIIF